MSQYGTFIKAAGGRAIGSTYEPTSEGLTHMINDYFDDELARYAPFARAAGVAGYGLNSPNGEGYFNALMGKEINVGVFSSDNIFTVLGARAYDMEGVRIQYQQSAYGLASEFVRNGQSMLPEGASGFQGIGAGTNQDGYIPDSYKLPVEDFRQPCKDLPFPYDYGLYLKAVENKDDTIAYRSYVDKIINDYTDNVDKALCRPITCAQPTANNGNIVSDRTAETSINGLARVISSGAEIGSTYGGVTVTESMVCPYGGTAGDYKKYRGLNTGSGESATHTKNAIDAKVVDAEGGVLNINMFRKLYRETSVAWKNMVSGKVILASNVAQDKLGALFAANNVLTGTEYIQKSINGVQTMPGRDVGTYATTYNNIPIIQDGNLNFDYTNLDVSSSKMGDIFFLDLEHIWISMLTPIQTWTGDNPTYNRTLTERNVMNSRCELRSNAYRFSGRLTNLADDDC